MIKQLNRMSNNFGFTQYITKGKSKAYNYYIMEKLGNSLKDMKSLIEHYTLENVLMIGIQMLNRLEVLHSQGYVHRDIKPANVMFGTGPKLNIIHIIDFGLIKRVSKFKEEKVPDSLFKQNCVSLSGTPNYASINLHCGWEE